jgi:hypothetical protein
MAVTLTTAARNAACNAIVDLVDAGSGDSTLVFYAADTTTEVATLTFATTAFGASGAVNPGEAVAAAITSDTSATGGTTTVAKFLDGDGTEVLRCTVGIGSGDIQLSNNVVAASETVAITELKVTVPA